LLQKLNAIDMLQIYMQKCLEQIKIEDEFLTKSELSFAMLQIFRS